MVYTSRIKGNADRRPRAFWGALIGAGASLIGGLVSGSQQSRAQRRALEEQRRLAQQQLEVSNQNQLASTLNNYALAQQSYDDKDYNLKYRIGGVKRLGSKNIMITDGGNAKRIGNNIYLLRGGSHEDINETGQTGIGINVGGNEIEAEGGEVAQRKGNSLRIYSAQPILGGISPAEAIMRGYNKDRVFNAQQRFKKNNGIKDDGSQQRNGGLTSKDRGSSKHPYPSVSSKDFAGGNRSYPIPTKADAIDALRLAGLHGRSDVRSKVYSKYPELRKKARGGTKVDPYYDWARNTSSNLGISFIDPTYDYRTYYNSVTPYERNLIRFAPQGTHFTDIGKTPFDPNSVPFLGNQSTFKPATQDYIGLGIDTLAALGSGMFTRSAYNKMNFDYALPNYVDESPVAFDTTYHNEAQRANIERNRLNARNLIRGNTASAQTSLGRMQQSDVDAMMETNKLLDEKSNKEVELRNQNAANEQQVRARNAAARNQYYQNVAQIKNAAIEAKNNAELAKAQSIGADLSGLSQAWTNFAGSVESRYDNRQKEAIIAATAKDPAVLSNAVQFGYNFSPEVLAAIYNSTDDDNLKSLALSQLSTKNRLRYGIR